MRTIFLKKVQDNNIMHGLVNSMQATTPIKIQYEQYGFQPHSMKPQNKLALSQASHANVTNTPSQILYT